MATARRNRHGFVDGGYIELKLYEQRFAGREMNDALRPFGARVTSQPMTPEVVLQALGKV